MSAQERFPTLFSPVRIGSKVAKNRIVVQPHGTNYGEDGVPGPRYLAYVTSKARGGTGTLILFGSSPVHPTSRGDWNEVENLDDRVVPHLTRVADAAHEYGALCLSQLTHRGRRGFSPYSGLPLWAPSDTWEEDHRNIPHVMSKADLSELREHWVRAARRLQRAGFDGVEIPIFGGHLLEQFLTPVANTRTDEYGGSLANRMRFAKEILSAIREQVGTDFVVGSRIAGSQFMDGGATPDEWRQLGAELSAEALVDFLLVGAGTTMTYEANARVTPSMAFPQGVNNEWARRIRDVVDVPVIASGRIVTPAFAEETLRSGAADLVGMNRAIMADPDLPNKAEQGRTDDIRYCIGANEGCLGQLQHGKSVTCVQNPALGRELEWGAPMHRVQRPRHVLVVGGGPGGLSAARLAAEYGHRVVLVERSPALGGQIITLARAPHRSGWLAAIDWMVRQCRTLGVDIRMDTVADLPMIRDLAFDDVIVATGAVPRRPAVPGIDADHVLDDVDVFEGRGNPGHRVAVVDLEGYHRAASVAELLATAGHDVEIVTPYESIAIDLDHTTRGEVHGRLIGHQVAYTPMTSLIEVVPTGILVSRMYTHQLREITVDTVVLANFARADDRLYHMLSAAGVKATLIGDALAPRRMHDAILDGMVAVRELSRDRAPAHAAG